jgi:hypothetical protein
MGKRLLGTFIVLLLSTGMEVEISDPEEVEVVSLAGAFSAEILCVRESSLVLVSPSGVDVKDPIDDKVEILVVRNDEVYSIKQAGNSHLLVGALVGCLGGCGTGLLVGKQKENEEQEKRDALENLAYGLSGASAVSVAAYAVAFGAGGTLLGGIIGSAVSSKDSVWISPTHRDFTALKALARYPEGEPTFLKEMGK